MNTPEFQLPEEPQFPREWLLPEPERRPLANRRATDRRSSDRRISRSVTPMFGAPIADDDPLGFPLTLRQLDTCVRTALREDGAFNDITAVACVVSTRRAHGTVVARNSGVVAGIPLAIAAFRTLDPNVAIRVDVDDGARVTKGTALMRITGIARAILSAERVALNYLQHLSGIATLTSRFVDAIRGTRARVIGTQMTTPGLHNLEQYAVRAGGVRHWEDGVSSTLQIKDNHLTAANGDVVGVVRRARELAPSGTRIEVECRSPGKVRQAIRAGADIILLDGMTPAQVRECVELINGSVDTEVSGSIGLDSVRDFAQTGADRIAIPVLTQCASILELALEFEAM